MWDKFQSLNPLVIRNYSKKLVEETFNVAAKG